MCLDAEQDLIFEAVMKRNKMIARLTIFKKPFRSTFNCQPSFRVSRFCKRACLKYDLLISE